MKQIVILDENDLREKISKIIEIADARADAEIITGENAMEGATSFAAIGFATGARFVRDMILGEFDFLFPDDNEFIEEDFDGNDT